MPSSDRPLCFLFDNGSLRAASTLSLRGLARDLESELGTTVRPVSLLHSSGVPSAELENMPAELLEPALLEFARSGGRAAVLLPLFFGPSAALTDYLPGRLRAIQRQYPDVRLLTARWLVDSSDDSSRLLAQVLADAVRATIAKATLRAPGVLLTDHGSPQAAVTAVRELLGQRLRETLGAEVGRVGVASMERRDGDAYRFNEPLLATALRTSPFDQGDVIVALQFLQPGRHAGPGGDIATICAEAEAHQPRLRTYLTEPIARDPRVVKLLARRYESALATGPRR